MTTMKRDILAFLRLFHDHVSDRETHGWVAELAANSNRWPEAHDVFDRIRKRNLKAITEEDHTKQCQYCFEEVCLKSLYNETDTKIPFDSDAPYSIFPCALSLARALRIRDEEVLHIVASHERA
jgi:hypothetical protein